VLAYGLLFGLIWLAAIGVVGLFICIIGWFMPSHEPTLTAER
jgi:hypothetical protein